jgi:hypothetical protein
MTRTRIALIAGAGLLLLAAVAAYLLLSNLDHLVERGIETYGSRAAGTRVSVDKVDIDLRRGRGSIRGLTVANPPGFGSEPIFALGEISLALEIASLSSPAAVIEEIRIDAPAFVYELNAQGGSNLSALEKNLQQSSRKKKPQQPSAKEESRRFRIKLLQIAAGKGIVDLTAGGDKRYEGRLKRITLKNLGGRQGVTAEELADAVLEALIRELEQVAMRQGTRKLLQGATDEALRRLQQH